MKLIEALLLADINARAHVDRTPTLGTLLEEVAEFARSLEGKHEHPPELELVQIIGISINLLMRYDYDAAFSALAKRRAEQVMLPAVHIQYAPLDLTGLHYYKEGNDHD